MNYPADHNRIHAADVLQAVYYLVSSSIPGFNQTHDSSSRYYCWIVGSLTSLLKPSLWPPLINPPSNPAPLPSIGSESEDDEIQDAAEHVPNGDSQGDLAFAETYGIYFLFRKSCFVVIYDLLFSGFEIPSNNLLPQAH